MTPERFRRLRAVLARRQPDLTVLMEHVHKPHNFSAVLRTCDAVGVFEAHAVTGGGPLPSHGGVSSGSRKWVRVRRHRGIGDALGHLAGRGFQILAAHLTDDAADFRAVDYTAPTAILLGTELHGVSDEAAAGADGCIRIPMAGLVASLNVSVAAAVILFEAQRQRAAAGLYDRPRLDAETRRRTLFEWAYPRLASYCRRKRFPYPRLSADGEILERIPH